jgi:hypothetical protein
MAGLGCRIADSCLSFAGGLNNRISDYSVQSAAFGAENIIADASAASFAAGADNRITDGSVHSAIFGAGNGICNGSTASFIAGTGNRITGHSVFSAVFGAGNEVANASAQSFISGTGNLIATGSVHSAIFGAGNRITETASQSFTAGGGNLITQSEAAAIFGRDSIIANGSHYSAILGGYCNSISNAQYAAVLGGICLSPVADCFAVADRLAIDSRLLLLGDGTDSPPNEGDILAVESLETLPAADGGTAIVPKVKWSGALTGEIDRAMAKETDLQMQLNAHRGQGGALSAHDFGVPSDQVTLEMWLAYAMPDIWGGGGDFEYNGDAPSESTYILNGNTYYASDIFNATWAHNLNDNHMLQLVNTPETVPPIFETVDIGQCIASQATDDLLGIVKGNVAGHRVNEYGEIYHAAGSIARAELDADVQSSLVTEAEKAEWDGKATMADLAAVRSENPSPVSAPFSNNDIIPISILDLAGGFSYIGQGGARLVTMSGYFQNSNIGNLPAANTQLATIINPNLRPMATAYAPANVVGSDGSAPMLGNYIAAISIDTGGAIRLLHGCSSSSYFQANSRIYFNASYIASGLGT